MPLYIAISRPLLAVSSMVLVLLTTACQTYSPYPTTQADGTYVKLPNASIKAVVWGARPESVQSLTTWLMKRGLTLVDDVKVNQMVTDMHIYKPVSTMSNAEIFKMGKAVGAKQIVFVDTDVSTWRTGDIEAFFGETQNLYTVSVFIRALDADSGEIQWSGKALSMNRFTNLKEGIHQLTCHALATAWGLRPPGLAVPPNICPVGQNVMVSNDTVRVPTSASETATTSPAANN